jgi:queuine tRNA-ribosyltransferase
MVEVLDGLGELLPADKPRYLMGVGMPRDLVAAVRCGIDLFDCVLPTRNGRNAYAFTRTGSVRLRNEKHKRSGEPIEPDCDCYACRSASLGYIRHLFQADEMLGPILVSIHNLRFFQRFMQRIRELIRRQELETIYDQYPVARPDAGAVSDEKELT